MNMVVPVPTATRRARLETIAEAAVRPALQSTRVSTMRHSLPDRNGGFAITIRIVGPSNSTV
jgi:hypothetical protein